MGDGASVDRRRALERLFEVALLLSSAMERDLAARGLTRARARLLWQVSHRGAATQRELADALTVTPRNVTGLVDALEGDGFVARRPHPTDRRAVTVTLTARGRAVAATLERDEQAFADLLLGHLGQRQLSGFDRRLAEVADRLRSDVEGATVS